MATCNLSASEAISTALNQVQDSLWTSVCIERLDWEAMLGNPHGGLVGQNGIPADCISNDTWGISYAACRQYCSFAQMPSSSKFDWANFGSEFNSYFLPWIALTAQLPFQTGGFLSDLMSGMLAVGSPALVTYSLGITLFNRRWAQSRFDRMYEKAKCHPTTNQEWILHRIVSMKFLLEEAQQEPLKINDRTRLRELIANEQDKKTWAQITRRLKMTRRTLTASLFAQNTVAIFAWVLTVVISFIEDNPSTQIAAGILWMWLIPVVCGWVAVGTQTRSQAVEEALVEAFEARRSQNLESTLSADLRDPIGISTPKKEMELTANITSLDGLLIAHCDSLRNGPLYNYARAPMWWKFARKMEKEGYNLIEEIQRPAIANSGAGIIMKEQKISCSRRFNAYPPLRKFLTEHPWHHILPILAAIIVQLGITFGAFIVAYETPPAGIGCNSGSYLIYGITAMLVFALVVASAILSHIVQYERERLYDMTTHRIRVLTMLALLTSAIGKLLALLNCLWLIASTLFVLGGLYTSCFCLSSAASLGDRGWVVFWAGNGSAQGVVSYWWTVGACMAAGVWLLFVLLLIFFSMQETSSRWVKWLSGMYIHRRHRML